MTRYVAFLRGINVSGQKKILMAQLRELLSEKGLKEVKTYIQSGNIVFQFSGATSEAETLIFKAIHKKYGWEVPVLVKTSSELTNILEGCPFSGEKKTKSYFILFCSRPEMELVKAVQELSSEAEEFFITPYCIYICLLYTSPSPRD